MADQYTDETGGQVTPQEVWAMIRETNRTIREMSEKAELRFQEAERRSQEDERRFRETDRKWKETTRAIGNLGNKMGLVVEHLVLANIMEKFNELGYEFDTSTMNVRIESKKKNIYTEVDAMLENGDFVVAIEVKTQLNIKDVDEHVERMEKLRLHAGKRYEKRKFLGAVAGAVVAENVKVYAQRKGFFVIRQSGDTVTVENPAGFVPRQW
jgi:CYTH domain-containing protein